MSSMSPITTLLPAACAPVVAIDANSSHGNARSAIVFFIMSVPLVVPSTSGAEIRERKRLIQLGFRSYARRLTMAIAWPAGQNANGLPAKGRPLQAGPGQPYAAAFGKL